MRWLFLVLLLGACEADSGEDCCGAKPSSCSLPDCSIECHDGYYAVCTDYQTIKDTCSCRKCSCE